MPGRETEYQRGFIRGVSKMMQLVSSGDVKKLDKTNILGYAQDIVEEMMKEKK